jgi:DNA-binding NtrC family response regulator
MNYLKDQLRQYEREIIIKNLAENDGNRSRTAQVLGISRRGLLNKLNSLGITAPSAPDEVAEVGSEEISEIPEVSAQE